MGQGAASRATDAPFGSDGAADEPTTKHRLTGARWALAVLALGVLYFLSGKAALGLATVNASASPVWPPTGIAIAGLLVLGDGAAAVVFLGAFAFNLATPGATGGTSLAIATGNTIEAFLGAWAMRRFAGGTSAFEHPRTVLRFAAIALAAPIASASVGVATLLATGLAQAPSASAVWLTWWSGDAAGALVFAPLLVLWTRPGVVHWTRKRAAEAAALGLGALLVGVLVLGTPYPVSYLLPFLIWAAFRFGPRETATLSGALSLFGVAATVHGNGPVRGLGENLALVDVEAFVGILTLTGLLLAAVVRQRTAAEDALLHSRDTFAQDARESTSLLADAQAIAHIGSWEWRMGPDEIRWSDELYRIYGVDAGTELNFDRFLASIHPEDRARIRSDVERALATGSPFAFQHRIVRPDGGLRWIQGRGIVESGADGRPARMLGTAQDVTDRRVSEERFQRVLEATPDALVLVDVAGRIVQVNPAAERLFGYGPGALEGHMIEVLVPAGLGDRHVEHRRGFLKDPRARPMGAGMDLHGVRRDGSVFPAEISLSPLATPEGMLIVSAVRDVSERRRMEREREELQRLREMDQFKTAFLNMAAHELNTPLTPIKLQMHILRETITPRLAPDQRRSFDVLERNLDRVALLVQNMLDVGRIQSGRVALHPERMDLAAAVAEAVESFVGMARAHEVTLEAGQAGAVWVDADAQRVSQILFNLLANAVKFTAAGGTILVSTEAREGAVVVRVRDTGVGLSAEQRTQLFRPFGQAHSGTQTAARTGTGLGLYISRQLAELHGGTLAVESPGPGLGSTFILTLPAAPPPTGPRPPPRPTAAPGGAGPTEPLPQG